MRKFTAVLIFAALMTVAASSQEAKPSSPAANPGVPKATMEQKLARTKAQRNYANVQAKLAQSELYQELMLAASQLQAVEQQMFAQDKADPEKFGLDENSDFVEIPKAAKK